MVEKSAISRMAAACAIVLCLVLPGISFLGEEACAAPLTTKTSWSGYLPKDTDRQYVPVNQTLTNHASDTHAEHSLVVNIDHIDLPHTGDNYYEVVLNVVGMANSRLLTDYYAISNSADQSLPKSLSGGGSWTLTGQGGKSVFTGDGVHLCYYGIWYDHLYISTNGFVIMTNEFPNAIPNEWVLPLASGSIPSTSSPNSVLAPLSRQFASGKVSWGNYSDSFWVIWDRKQEGGPWEKFGIQFRKNSWTDPVTFIYSSVNWNAGAVIGYEDQFGKKGQLLSQPPAGDNNWEVKPNSDTNNYWIRGLSVKATKTQDGVSNDPYSEVDVRGRTDKPVSGTNLENYYDGGPLDDGGSSWDWLAPSLDIGLTGVTCLCAAYSNPITGAIAGAITIYGLLMDGKDLADALSPVHPAALIPAGRTQTEASVNSYAMDDLHRLDQSRAVWDATFFPQIRWKIWNDAGVLSCDHLLSIELTTTVRDWPTGGIYTDHTITTKVNLMLGATTGLGLNEGASWAALTNPDAHDYSFYLLQTPYGMGYHLDCNGASDSNYQMMAFDTTSDYVVSPDGTLKIAGFFRMSDQLIQHGIPVTQYTRYLKLFVLDASAPTLRNVLSSQDILDYTQTIDEWHHVEKVFQLGTQFAGKLVKVAIGRPMNINPPEPATVEFVGVMIYDSDDVHRLKLTAGTGGTTDPSPGTYYYYYPWASVLVTAVPNSGNLFRRWVDDNDPSFISTANPIYIDVSSGNKAITAYFINRPYCTIMSISPSPATVGQTVTFSGNAWDSDGTVAIYHWWSDLQGDLSYALSFSRSDLVAGTHTISFQVTDNEGYRSDVATRALVVNVQQGYRLTIQVSSGGTTNPAPGTYTYSPGTSVKVTATPYGGYQMYTWFLDGVDTGSSSKTYTVAMNGDHVLTAYFARKSKT